MTVLNKIMGVDEASELWGLSPGYIKNLCANNKIECKKIGKTWIISKEQPNPKKKCKIIQVFRVI
ncbi:helix-turn-helix domain-containing protein [Bacillus pumilus]|uniref:helix-turn-helix domain-containing protein n=1 Tax=Bacillus pumilus TaxID=1408 RepID=UPI003D725BDB